MQKIGDSTGTANAAGEYTEGNPGAGVDATLLKADWLNTIQRELIAVVQGAGITLDKTKFDQVLTAIKAMIQGSATNYAADTGTANVYAATFVPAITALTDGTVVRVKIKTANSGASTFNPNGLGAKPIVGSAHAALQGGELVANGHAWLQYNSSLSGGSWVILASSGGAQQVPSASKSAQAVNLSQLGSYNGYLSAIANLTLTSTALGKVVFGDATDVVITLPIAQQLEGSTITIVALSDCTVAAAAGQFIRIGSTNNSSMQLLRGEQLTIFSVNLSSWYVASYAKHAGNLRGLLGYSATGALDVNAFGRLVNVSFSHVVVTLPPVGGAENNGKSIIFAAPNGCTLKGSGAELIYDRFGASANTLVLGAGEQIQLVTDGSSWRTGLSSKPANQATETLPGISKVATQSLTDAGLDGSSMVTPKTLRGVVGSFFKTIVNVTASRAVGVTYTNTSGKPMFVNVELQTTVINQTARFAVNGINLSGSGFPTGNSSISGSIIVPAGGTYSVLSGAYNIWNWVEMT